CLAVADEMQIEARIFALKILVGFAPAWFTGRAGEREFRGSGAVVVINMSAARNFAAPGMVPVVEGHGRTRTLVVRDFPLKKSEGVGTRVVVQISANLAGGISQTTRMKLAGRIQKQTSGFRRRARDDDERRVLLVALFLVIEILHPGGTPLFINEDACDECPDAQLAVARFDGLRKNGDVGSRLCLDLAVVSEAPNALYARATTLVRSGNDGERRRKWMPAQAQPNVTEHFSLRIEGQGRERIRTLPGLRERVGSG